MTSKLTDDFFTLFQLPRQFALDEKTLQQTWRHLVTEVHPDRFATAPGTEKQQALMLAAHINEAYQTLKSPVNRARYLLNLAGVDTQEENNTQMPVDFLMEQMQWRERIEEAQSAKRIEQLETLAQELHREQHALEQNLMQQLDKEKNLDASTVLVRKLRFFEKLDQEINNAIEAVLD